MLKMLPTALLIHELRNPIALWSNHLYITGCITAYLTMILWFIQLASGLLVNIKSTLRQFCKQTAFIHNIAIAHAHCAQST